MSAVERRVSSAEGRALTHGDAHQQGTGDAVREAERRHPRRAPVRVTHLQIEAEVERQALAHAANLRSPRGRLEMERRLASMLASTGGEVLHGDADERELRLAEDDVIGAIYARRAAL